MQSLSNILSGQTAPYAGYRRTYEPVRRHSYRIGRETGFWKPTNRQDAKRIVLAARKYELDTKGKGARNGALGPVALEVIEYLANLVDYRTGRLEPSIETMKKRLRRSRDAIVRALKALRTHGFLDWIRRYEPTGNEGEGPQIKQASNAYKLSLPNRAVKLLGRYFKTPPLPADIQHDQDHKAAQLKDMLQGLPLAEYARFEVEDDKLAEVLARLGSSIEERESARQTESLSKGLLYTRDNKRTP